jgi:hypothetical protein
MGNQITPIVVGDRVILIGYDGAMAEGRYLGPHTDERFKKTHSLVCGEKEWQQSQEEDRRPSYLGWPNNEIKKVEIDGE